MKFKTDKTVPCLYGPREGQLGERVDPDPHVEMSDWEDHDYRITRLHMRTNYVCAQEQVEHRTQGLDVPPHPVVPHPDTRCGTRVHTEVIDPSDSEAHTRGKLFESIEGSDPKATPQPTPYDTAYSLCPIGEAVPDTEEPAHRNEAVPNDSDGSARTDTSTHKDNDPIQYITLRMKGQ